MSVTTDQSTLTNHYYPRAIAYIWIHFTIVHNLRFLLAESDMCIGLLQFAPPRCVCGVSGCPGLLSPCSPVAQNEGCIAPDSPGSRSWCPGWNRCQVASGQASGTILGSGARWGTRFPLACTLQGLGAVS